MTWTRSEWNEDRIAVLKELRKQGYSASQIASRMGGVTRNSVIGKLARLGMTSARAQSLSATMTATRRNVAKLKQAAMQAGTPRTRHKVRLAEIAHLPEETPPPGPVVTFSALEPHHCRFPYGDPRSKDFGFCGCQKLAGSPYCPAHTRKAYVMVSPSRPVEHVAKTDGKVFA